MSYPTASYDQLVRQVEDLRKENSHLRRELQDNSHHLSKLENETSDMKEVLRQLQSKLEQEAGTLASSGRTDVLDQLKAYCGLWPILFKFTLTKVIHYLNSEFCPTLIECSNFRFQECVFVCFRSMLLSEIEKEERERRWYYSQLQGLSQRLAELPRLDTFSMQVDFIRQQLEFEAQQLRSVMEERFGTSDEMVQRTQIRVARLEQLEKELQEAQSSRGPQEKSALPETQVTHTPLYIVFGLQVEMVFWLLSMLASRDREEMSRTLLTMSSSQESCIAMRKSGCVPLLVQILHEGGTGEAAGTGGYSREARSRASAALHNIVYSQPDEGQARREMRVIHVLEQIRSHCENGWDWIENHLSISSSGGAKTTVDPQMCQALCAIMKLSFEEEYRRAMNELGGLQAIAELMQLDQEMYGMHNEPINMALRRYAGMALTNLTYGDVVNKATLCSKKNCLQAIVAQLASDSEELQQVVSSILRNLSWRADINSKRALRDVGSVSALMTCALQATKESTLKSVLSALWNLSAHSTENKVAICSVNGSLGFLVSTLTYRCQTNSLAIIESGGGILRNVSSLIATRDDYRQILRDHNCLQTLLQHLRSHSLTIVSNACGTLWNLSARSPKDQELLWDLGAVSMLRNLIHSKHKMIAMGSAAALRNLLTNRPLKYKDTAVISPGSCMPSLYMRKQKALEAELDAKHLAETFDSIEKRSFKHQSINKPLRHIESLAKDYASDSGCFDDDEAPNVSTSLDTGTFSMLAMFLNNSNFLNTQSRKREGEPEQDVETFQTENKRSQPPDDEVTVAAEKLAKKITNTVAKIDKLVEDITMHTSSEDSFSLSSEDHFVDWNYGPDELHEGRAISCSPCHLSDTSSFLPKERLSRAHAFLRLKTANSSLSNDSLNSGSTSDGYCVMCQNEIPERDFERNKDAILPDSGSTDTEKSQEPFISTPATVSTKVSSDASIPTVKLSPSYQHVPLIQSVAKFGVAKTAINVQAAQAMRRQAWVPTVMTGGSISKFPPICSARSPTIGQLETPQKYSVENTPICFSRCSSLSSLSSGDGALDGQSQTENELESDSSLEIIEVEDVNVERKDEEDETLDDLSDSQLLLTDQKISSSDPTEIPSTIKNEKKFLRGVSPVILEDRTPSSSSENYIHETPLVMSRCSSVSSLGSFESPSIASSIQSDPCSEMISGTVSPSDLPDSPGQTMPPSRSKTPCCAESSGPETQNLSGVGSQWENSLRKFMEIADFKERFNLPPDLDTMIYFTVEKPTENFSCASSLSALPLHEHYVQKDVELKLTPLLNQQDNDPEDSEKEEDMDDQDQYSEGNSDDDIEILKECINSAMPSRFKKVRPTVMPNLSNQFGMSSKEIYHDDSSYTDSAEGTPINFSSTTSLSDETLQYPLRTKEIKDWRRNKETQELVNIEAKRIEDLRMFSRFHKPTKMTCQSHIVTDQLNKTIGHMVPTQRLLIQSKEMTAKVTQQRIQSQSPVRQIQKQGQNLSKSMPHLNIPKRKQNTEQNLILEEAPPCYSLSSSLSSLSDAEFEEHHEKPQHTWIRNKHNLTSKPMCPPKSQQDHKQFEENSSPSSVSMDSEDDLLIKCITSAMPQHKKKQAARKKKAEKKHKQKATLQKATEWSPENDLDSDEMASDKDSDLNSVEWRAIQEGANTIITKLQASKSQEPSSESESVMSFMSGSSFTPKEKKVYKDDKKANKPLDFAPRKPVPNFPVVFRGRTVIYTPKKETTLSQRPPPKKVIQKSDAPKNPNLAQHRSRSLHRLGHPMDSTQLSLPKRSSTPPARIPKSSSSGSSQSSTPSRHPQKKVTSPTQTIKQGPAKVASAPCSPPDKRGSTSNINQNSKSPVDRKTQKSPVRIPFMQNPSRQTRNISPLVTNQPTNISRQNTQISGKRILPANRMDLVRMTSTHSSSGESDHNGFLRQLTFIKESSKVLRHDAASRSVPTSQHASPRRAVPGAPAVFLCSSRCQELKEAVQATSIDRDVTVKRPARRTSSESPCRVSQRNTPGPKPREKREDTIKRYSSSPSINVLSRVTSRSSLRSSSSDSSGQAKSERNTNQRQQRAGSRNSDRVTWRRIRDEDVPQILKSTLPPTALPLLPSPEASRKTSDAIVQTEDYSANKTNSSTSPTIEKVLNGDSDGSLKTYSTASTSTFQSVESTHSGGVGHFRQSSPSKAVRVTPFNYIPSPMVCCSPQTHGQAKCNPAIASNSMLNTHLSIVNT
uniref:Adenomatous polyposis coli protein 2 n=1 Tax=Sinocyclocheilus anshuiensis TaxID=1608454 RepID=A0A671QUC8_9TELE